MRGRGDRLQELVAARELDLMLVTDLVNVRYLTGFTGTNGACVCGPGVRLFLTDFRYTERAEAEVEGWETETARGDWGAAIAARLRGKVGFEDDHMAVRSLEKLKEKLGEGVEAVPAGGLVEGLRRVKDEGELAAIEEASKLADAVWAWSLDRGLAGRAEREVARAAEARIRELGGEPSFPAIVAAGPNGALPHAEPGEREIGRGELVVFDMGAQLDGYCSDGTRTFATGEPGEEQREVYDLVLAAQLAALGAIAVGKTGEEVDAVAREIIDEAGHGEHFGHGLGHGVGLEVHEGPRLSPRSDDVLAAGEVVTVEPGVYLPGSYGVRIEDFVVLAEDGYRNLSTVPKELTVLD
jgi:Xaa-Pro aminopeptidase